MIGWIVGCMIFIDYWDLVSGSYPNTQDSSPVIKVFMKSGTLFVESIMSCDFWVYGYDPEPVVFLAMKIRRKHKTLPHSNAACHQLTPLTVRKNSRMSMKVQVRLMQARFTEIRQVFAK